MASPSNKGKNIAEGSTSEQPQPQPQPQQPQPPPNSPALSRYESQKRRDWNTLERQRFMHMDVFSSDKLNQQDSVTVHQAWGSLDALIGRLRAAYEENGGFPERNPFAGGGIRVFLREVRDSQAKARGVPYKKRKKKRGNPMKSHDVEDDTTGTSSSNLPS
ncbi:unnamed protein product [Brassica rapa]|uniref:ALOG domain-containing protein n=1 Tax=Brassica campestris TaxID=3711 RepID=A0A3P6BV69_BRACM|nr:unnamed protein product [Brassica rapa]VDD00172.1 unnamed protein product [Brassica rapa]